VHLVGSPLKLTANPVAYRLPPPVCGADTENVLNELLGLDTDKLHQLRNKKIIA
jgi:crotonobetainyl-CoA:carnitine CoA-transferase CaiB-like acyl-CoA transferase